jgi:hypothetical protein
LLLTQFVRVDCVKKHHLIKSKMLGIRAVHTHTRFN